ncbi:MAG: polyprenyl diphosphate synthase [Spirochaetia bacterium]
MIHPLPRHLGIIMDGNGRWATGQNLPRNRGHREGLEAAKNLTRAAARLNIPYLSLYTFSTENWKRAEEEVGFLMNLIIHNLKREFKFYQENNIRILHSGDKTGLPLKVQKEIAKAMEMTKKNSGLILNLAINYGGRDEIVRAVNRILARKEQKEITEDDITRNLDLPEFPPPDLIIRTAGEQRLSNFLLWESSYAELYFTRKLFPDFQEDDLIEALEEFASRTRKYGGIV